MKRTLLALVLVVCTASSSVLAATECTPAQISAGNALADDPAIKTACPVVLASGNITSLDVSVRATSANPCGLASCASYLAQLTQKFPDCQSGGVNMRMLVAAFVEFCKSDSWSVTPTTTPTATKSNSTNSTGTGSSSGSGASSSSSNNDTIVIPDPLVGTATGTPSSAPSSGNGATPAAGSGAPASHLLTGSAVAIAMAAIALIA